MNRETYIDGNKTIIDTNFYLNLLQCENNQNKLISFLEDKIRNQDKLIKEPVNEDNYRYQIAKSIAYQEILDFVNQGGNGETK